MKFSKASAAPLLLLLLYAYAPAQALSPSRVVAAAKRADNSGSPDADDDGGNDYLVSVCLPSAAPDTTALPPCLDVIAIETACAPNGTSPLALEAHAQCLCGGSYFAEWLGCRACLEVHGILSPGNYSYFSAVIASASDRLCTGAPTAPLASLFASVEAEVPAPTPTPTLDAALPDVSSGDAAVSLYYTASGLQGPGPITGSATLATAEAGTTGTGSAGTTTGGGVSSSSAGSAGAQSTTNAGSSTTSSSSNIAAPTGAAGGGKGAFLVAAVGGVVLAAI